MLKATAVIPSRWGSTRFPGKSLAPILGVPLVIRVAGLVSRTPCFCRTLVATDDERIRSAVESAGFECVMTRPDHQSGTDRIAEAVAGDASEMVVNIQGDEPLIEPDNLVRLVDALNERRDWDMATACAPLQCADECANPNVVKVVRALDGSALYFSRSAIPFVRDRQPAVNDVLFWRHIGVYAYRRDFLMRFVGTAPTMLEKAERLEQLRALEIGAKIGVIETTETGRGVDSPEDVVYVETMMRRRGLT